jgi:hypothetical protein
VLVPGNSASGALRATRLRRLPVQDLAYETQVENKALGR